MASCQEIVSTKDPDEIKKRRKTIKGMLTSIQNHMAGLLEKTAGSFDHAQIERPKVLTDLAKLKKNEEDFDLLHMAYIHYRERGKTEPEDEAFMLK